MQVKTEVFYNLAALSLPQKDINLSQMEMNALKVAEDINAEYWSVSSKSGTACRSSWSFEYLVVDRFKVFNEKVIFHF